MSAPAGERFVIVRVCVQEELGSGFLTLRCKDSHTVAQLRKQVLAKVSSKIGASKLGEDGDTLAEDDFVFSTVAPSTGSKRAKAPRPQDLLQDARRLGDVFPVPPGTPANTGGDQRCNLYLVRVAGNRVARFSEQSVASTDTPYQFSFNAVAPRHRLGSTPYRLQIDFSRNCLILYKFSKQAAAAEAAAAGGVAGHGLGGHSDARFKPPPGLVVKHMFLLPQCVGLNQDTLDGRQLTCTFEMFGGGHSSILGGLGGTSGAGGAFDDDGATTYRKTFIFTDQLQRDRFCTLVHAGIVVGPRAYEMFSRLDTDKSGTLDPAELGADLKDLAFESSSSSNSGSSAANTNNNNGSQSQSSQSQQKQSSPPQPVQISFQDFLLAYFAARGRQIQHLGGGQAVYEDEVAQTFHSQFSGLINDLVAQDLQHQPSSLLLPQAFPARPNGDDPNSSSHASGGTGAHPPNAGSSSPSPSAASQHASLSGLNTSTGLLKGERVIMTQPHTTQLLGAAPRLTGGRSGAVLTEGAMLRSRGILSLTHFRLFYRDYEGRHHSEIPLATILRIRVLPSGRGGGRQIRISGKDYRPDVVYGFDAPQEQVNSFINRLNAAAFPGDERFLFAFRHGPFVPDWIPEDEEEEAQGQLGYHSGGENGSGSPNDEHGAGDHPAGVNRSMSSSSLAMGSREGASPSSSSNNNSESTEGSPSSSSSSSSSSGLSALNPSSFIPAFLSRLGIETSSRSAAASGSKSSPASASSSSSSSSSPASQSADTTAGDSSKPADESSQSTKSQVLKSEKSKKTQQQNSAAQESSSQVVNSDSSSNNLAGEIPAADPQLDAEQTAEAERQRERLREQRQAQALLAASDPRRQIEIEEALWGWRVYDRMAEYARLGLVPQTDTSSSSNASSSANSSSSSSSSAASAARGDASVFATIRAMRRSRYRNAPVVPAYGSRAGQDFYGEDDGLLLDDDDTSLDDDDTHEEEEEEEDRDEDEELSSSATGSSSDSPKSDSDRDDSGGDSDSDSNGSQSDSGSDAGAPGARGTKKDTKTRAASAASTSRKSSTRDPCITAGLVPNQGSMTPGATVSASAAADSASLGPAERDSTVLPGLSSKSQLQLRKESSSESSGRGRRSRANHSATAASDPENSQSRSQKSRKPPKTKVGAVEDEDELVEDLEELERLADSKARQPRSAADFGLLDHISTSSEVDDADHDSQQLFGDHLGGDGEPLSSEPELDGERVVIGEDGGEDGEDGQDEHLDMLGSLARSRRNAANTREPSVTGLNSPSDSDDGLLPASLSVSSNRIAGSPSRKRSLASGQGQQGPVRKSSNSTGAGVGGSQRVRRGSLASLTGASGSLRARDLLAMSSGQTPFDDESSSNSSGSGGANSPAQPSTGAQRMTNEVFAGAVDPASTTGDSADACGASSRSGGSHNSKNRTKTPSAVNLASGRRRKSPDASTASSSTAVSSAASASGSSSDSGSDNERNNTGPGDNEDDEDEEDSDDQAGPPPMTPRDQSQPEQPSKKLPATPIRVASTPSRAGARQSTPGPRVERAGSFIDPLSDPQLLAAASGGGAGAGGLPPLAPTGKHPRRHLELSQDLGSVGGAPGQSQSDGRRASVTVGTISGSQETSSSSSSSSAKPGKTGKIRASMSIGEFLSSVGGSGDNGLGAASESSGEDEDDADLARIKQRKELKQQKKQQVAAASASASASSSLKTGSTSSKTSSSKASKQSKKHAKSKKSKEEAAAAAEDAHMAAFEGDGDLAELFRVVDNRSFKLSPTYPEHFLVPRALSEEALRKVCGYRSKARVPAVVWVHPETCASIARCAQPLPGIRGARCEEDELMLQLLLQCNPTNRRTLYIVDARPFKAAMGNQVMGKGFEQTQHYRNCELLFMGIDNIHAIRGGMEKLVDLLSLGNKAYDDSTWLSSLEKTQWLHHVRVMLAAGARMAAMLDEEGASVVVHCSDGWDRTSQLAGIAQILLDPYYRTLVGFAVLLEKEWLDFGHKFAERFGHADGNFSNEQRAPIFVQFLDGIWQLMRQFPMSFEFNERFLLDLLDHLYSCRFGTFLFETRRERSEHQTSHYTRSVWSEMLSARRRPLYTNPLFVPHPDDLHPSHTGKPYPHQYAGEYLASHYDQYTAAYNAANAAVTSPSHLASSSSPGSPVWAGDNRLQDLGGLDLDAGAGLLFVPNIADLSPDGGGSGGSSSSAGGVGGPVSVTTGQHASSPTAAATTTTTGGAAGKAHRLNMLREGFGPNQGLFQHPQTQLRYRQQLRRDRELRLEAQVRSAEAQLAQVQGQVQRLQLVRSGEPDKAGNAGKGGKESKETAEAAQLQQLHQLQLQAQQLQEQIRRLLRRLARLRRQRGPQQGSQDYAPALPRIPLARRPRRLVPNCSAQRIVLWEALHMRWAWGLGLTGNGTLGETVVHAGMQAGLAGRATDLYRLLRALDRAGVDPSVYAPYL